MWCSNCGKELPTSADGSILKFCPFCGAKVVAAVQQAAQIADTVSEKADEVAADISEAKEAASEIEGLVTDFSDKAEDAAAEAEAAVDNLVTDFTDKAEEVAETAEAAVENLVTDFTDKAEEVAETAEATVDNLVTDFSDKAEETAEAAEDIATEAESAAKEAAESLEDAAENAINNTENAASQIISSAEETAKEAESAAEDIKTAAVAAAAAVPAAAAAEAVTSDNEQPKKKSKLWLIILIAIVVLAVAGYFIYQNLPSTKLAKCMSEVNAAASQGSYELALEKLNLAKEISPDNPDVTSAEADINLQYAGEIISKGDIDNALPRYFNALELAGKVSEDKKNEFTKTAAEQFSKAASAAVDAGDFEKARKTLTFKRDLLLEDEDKILDEFIGTYSAEAAAVIERGDRPEITEYINNIYEVASDPKYVNHQDKFDSIISGLENVESRLLLGELGAELKKYVDNDNGTLATNNMYLELMSPLGSYNYLYKWLSANTNILPLIADIDGKESIGAYNVNNRLYLYIGEYKDGKRSGNGAWLTYLGSSLSTIQKSYMRSNWENDLPNGDMTYWEYTKKSGEDPSEITYAGSVKDGKFDGEVTVSYKNGGTYKPTFKDGIPEILDTFTSDGTEHYVIAYSEDRSTMLYTANKTAVWTIRGFE